MTQLPNTTRRLKEYARTMDSHKLAKIAYDAFVAATPVASGAARDSTRLSGDTIHADYPYAKRLNDGYSKQSPDGMVQSAIDAVHAHIATELGIDFKGK